MPQTTAWHSSDEGVHHDNTECVRGARIPISERAPGDGGKPLCSICEHLDQAEQSLG
ncbi:MAG: hypothetical protein ACRDM8_02515 [Gaiellaceae bacterium]